MPIPWSIRSNSKAGLVREARRRGGRLHARVTLERLRRLAASILRRCSPETIVAEGQWKLIRAWHHGHVHVLQSIWQRLGIDTIVRERAGARGFGFDVERALFAMVANRACAPASRLYCHEQWLREDVRIAGTETLELQHLYRAMDFLEANKEAIEQAIFYKVADLLNLDVDVVFYDTTSLHFEIDEEDQAGSRGNRLAGANPASRKRGHSRNGRTDAAQIVVGLAVTRDGFPVRHWVFPGNTVDVSTVARVKQDLRGWQLTRCLFVGDAGMVSQANFAALAGGGDKYLMTVPMRRGDEVTEQVMGRPGRYRKVAENLEVKEVVVGEGERRRRYAVCLNPMQAARQQAHRDAVLRELDAELASLADCRDGHSRRVCALRASARYGRYLRATRTGLAIDRAAVGEAARFDGKFVVHSNDDTLSAQDMALGYEQLQRVEQTWRTSKSGLGMRPVCHWVAHRIHAHVAITVLTLLLERTIEHACQDTWRNVRDDLGQIQLAQLFSPHGTVWRVTDPTPEAARRLKSLKIKPPAPIVDVA